MRSFDKKVFKYLTPHYSELVNFLTIVTLLLLVIGNSEFREGLFTFLAIGVAENVGLVFLKWLLVAGLVVSLYEVFSVRQRSELSKIFLLTFSILVTSIVSVLAFLYLLSISDSRAWYLGIFPLINILQTIAVMVLYVQGEINISVISNRQTKIREAILGSLTILALYLVTQIVFELHPIIILSIGIAYAMQFSASIERFPTFIKN